MPMAAFQPLLEALSAAAKFPSEEAVRLGRVVIAGNSKAKNLAADKYGSARTRLCSHVSARAIPDSKRQKPGHHIRRSGRLTVPRLRPWDIGSRYTSPTAISAAM